jgi:hypothetical protein
LSPLPPGGPHEVVVISDEETIRIDDVLVGDVWLCCGQSNMEFTLEASTGGLATVTEAAHPAIRLLNLPHVSATAPSADIEAVWAVCSPLTARVLRRRPCGLCSSGVPDSFRRATLTLRTSTATKLAPPGWKPPTGGRSIGDIKSPRNW